MNIAETLRGLLRRWYIVGPGLLLAASAAVATWMHVPPSYERTATQLLLPAEATLPEIEIQVEVEDGEDGETETETLAPNPFLYLGGLNTAADVLVSAVAGAPAVADALDRYDGAEVSVTRDPSSPGPMVLVTVTAASDESATELIDFMLAQSRLALDDLQTSQSVPDESRVRISPIAVDTESTLGNRDRMTLTAGAGAAIALLSVLLAAAVDGLVRSRRRRRGARRGARRRDRTRPLRRTGTAPEGEGLAQPEPDEAGAAEPLPEPVGAGRASAP
ncbi:hypothetical protein [Microbacterium sp. NPDC096154]|uniref:hypothetical protein n=1 Tax=Microbacterium sp. NPDC096154 TaxID=3155549 RepID=UPI0033268BFC